MRTLVLISEKNPKGGSEKIKPTSEVGYIPHPMEGAVAHMCRHKNLLKLHSSNDAFDEHKLALAINEMNPNYSLKRHTKIPFLS